MFFGDLFVPRQTSPDKILSRIVWAASQPASQSDENSHRQCKQVLLSKQPEEEEEDEDKLEEIDGLI